MLAVASLKRSLEFDPVKQGVKRKRVHLKLATLNKNSLVCSTNPSPKPSITSTSSEDIPMFTSLQAAQLCARLLRDQDRTMREQYEQILMNKLNEQYDTFVRYSHDNVHKAQSKPTWSCADSSQKSSTNNQTTPDFSYIS